MRIYFAGALAAVAALMVVTGPLAASAQTSGGRTPVFLDSTARSSATTSGSAQPFTGFIGGGRATKGLTSLEMMDASNKSGQAYFDKFSAERNKAALERIAANQAALNRQEAAAVAALQRTRPGAAPARAGTASSPGEPVQMRYRAGGDEERRPSRVFNIP